MQFLLALLIGILFGAGLFMILRRSIVKIILGLALLGQGANLLIFSMGGVESELPPLIDSAATTLTGNFADPVPQALILTAIVIGFGAQAFAIVLVKRVYAVLNSDDLDLLNSTDQE
ncbi:MAG: Na+/H+ antiporter subunit C [Chloroflexi bacterium]|nr:Na+/H+ antiporter subunit C [Chloroflexota bacterium]